MITATIIICLLSAASTPEACNEANAAKIITEQHPTMSECWKTGAHHAIEEIERLPDHEMVFRVVCK